MPSEQQGVTFSAERNEIIIRVCNQCMYARASEMANERRTPELPTTRNLNVATTSSEAAIAQQEHPAQHSSVSLVHEERLQLSPGSTNTPREDRFCCAQRV